MKTNLSPNYGSVLTRYPLLQHLSDQVKDKSHHPLITVQWGVASAPDFSAIDDLYCLFHFITTVHLSLLQQLIRNILMLLKDRQHVSTLIHTAGLCLMPLLRHPSLPISILPQHLLKRPHDQRILSIIKAIAYGLSIANGMFFWTVLSIISSWESLFLPSARVSDEIPINGEDKVNWLSGYTTSMTELGLMHQSPIMTYLRLMFSPTSMMALALATRMMELCKAEGFLGDRWSTRTNWKVTKPIT